MQRSFALQQKIAEKLIENRWLLIVLLCAFGLIFETIDNWVDNEPFDATYFREVFFFGVIYPIAVGWLLTILLQARTQRDEALQQQSFSDELLAAPNWASLIKVLTSFPQTVAPIVGVDLFLLSQENGEFSIAADWSLSHPLEKIDLPAVDPSLICGVSKHLPGFGLHPFTRGPMDVKSASNGYCLPLFRGDELIGLMQMHVPPGKDLTIDQIKLFNRIAPAIASAIDSHLPEGPDAVLIEAARLERERIAQQLHDTLGQSLSYLRMTLDHLNMNDVFARFTAIQQELDRMRDISHDAYEQIRHSLISLQPEYEGNISDRLYAMALESAGRAGFDLQFRVRGESRRMVTTIMQRKILLIIREALTNIERHANARVVNLNLGWNPDAFIITLEDDGSGFDPDATDLFGHFGLKIMQQRAEEINSKLELVSSPNHGTKVILEFPFNEENSILLQGGSLDQGSAPVNNATQSLTLERTRTVVKPEG